MKWGALGRKIEYTMSVALLGVLLIGETLGLGAFALLSRH